MEHSTEKNYKKFSLYPAVMGEVCESECSGYASCDSELENTWLRYEEAIKSEHFYVLNTVFELDSDVSLHCGLTPARSFEPAIKLCQVENSQISFNVFEWAIFINLMNQILTDNFTVGGEPDDHGLW
ncbi:hypothetical protein JTB14_008267 [Gonioctena quinquepunctata]|nr:hypothetical protein JTB14_008267 [Gonioctena quinquepunctata]